MYVKDAARFKRDAFQVSAPARQAQVCDKARALAERMGKTLKQNVGVENRPGGQAIIATVAVARAEPDGYTLGFAGTNGMILNPLLYNNLPYQQSDFKQLGSMGKAPMLVSVHPALGVKNVQEFIALAKKKPGDITCAHAGRAAPRCWT
ncbi:hypothetical protein G6F32_015467 [Rhizopus arrhizus]|nr:hypothetical protein G6F32_015467 [Rhizopus arrhizus]